MIPETEPVKNHFGNNSATQFDFDFYIENETQLKVVHYDFDGNENTLEYGVDYSIHEIGNTQGSYIIFPIQGSNYNVLAWNQNTDKREMLSLVLDLPFTQEAEYEMSKDLNKKNLEKSLDKLTRIAQILRRQVTRAVKVPEGQNINADELFDKFKDDVNTTINNAENNLTGYLNSQFVEAKSELEQSHTDFKNEVNTIIDDVRNAAQQLSDLDEAVTSAQNAKTAAEVAQGLAEQAKTDTDNLKSDVEQIKQGAQTLLNTTQETINYKLDKELDKATIEEALEGVDDIKYMTSLKVKESVLKNAPVDIRNVIKSCNTTNGNASLLYIEGEGSVLTYHDIIEQNASCGDTEIFGGNSWKTANSGNYTYTFSEPVKTINGLPLTLSFFVRQVNGPKTWRGWITISYTDGSTLEIINGNYNGGNYTQTFYTDGKSIASIRVGWTYATSGDGNVGVGKIQINAPYYKTISSAEGINFDVSQQIPLICTYPNGQTKTLENVFYLDCSSLSNGNYSAFVNDVGISVAKGNYYVQKTEPLNLLKTGNPTIINGIISNFSTNNYITTDVFNPNTNSWEMVLSVTTGDNVTNSESFIVGDNTLFSISIGVVSGKLDLYLSSNGTGYDIARDIRGTFNVQPNTHYFIKLIFTGTQYIVSYSEDGIDYTNDITVSSSSIVYANRIVFGLTRLKEAGFTGTINLHETYIKINNVLWWSAYKNNDVWLNTSIFPNKLKTYDGETWQDFEAVYLGNFTVQNGFVTRVKSASIMDWSALCNIDTVGLWGLGVPDYTNGLTINVPTASSPFIAPESGIFTASGMSNARTIATFYIDNVQTNFRLDSASSYTTTGTVAIPLTKNQQIYSSYNDSATTVVFYPYKRS